LFSIVFLEFIEEMKIYRNQLYIYKKSSKFSIYRTIMKENND